MGEARVDFTVGRIGDVTRALEGLDKILIKLDRESNVRSRRMVQHGEGIARVHKKQADVAIREAERESKEVFRAMSRAQKEKERAATRGAALAKREADASIREADRAAKAKVRIDQRAEADKTRIEARAQRERDQQAARNARQEYRHHYAGVRDRQREALETFRGRERLARHTGHVVGRSIGGLVNGATRLAGMALSVGGGFALADVASRSMSAERAAIALSNTSTVPGTPRPDVNMLLSRATAVQGATNIGKEEVLAGWQAYVAQSGKFKGSEELMPDLAKLAKASGANFGDVAKAAGTLRAQNENMSAADMKRTMMDIVAQGKLGSVELSDLAQVAGKTTASSAMYEGSQTTSQRRLLGLSQIAMKTAGSPEEAATAVTRLGSDILSHADAKTGMLGGYNGIQVADKKTGLLKDPAEILADMMQKTGGHLGKMGELGLGDRAIKVAEALAPTYQDAERKQKGSGRNAVLREVRKFTEASYSDADRDKDFAAVMAGSAEKFDGAVNKVREAIEVRLTPFLNRLADKLPELIPKIERFIDAMGKIAEFLVDNPWKGLGILVAGTIAKDLALAGIGEAAKTTLARLIAGAAPGAISGAAGPGAGAAGSAGASSALTGVTGVGMAAVGGIAAAAAVTGVEGSMMLDSAIKGRAAGQGRAEILKDMAGRSGNEGAVQAELAAAHQEAGVGGYAKTALAGLTMGTSTIADAVGIGSGNASLKQIEKFEKARAIDDQADKIVAAMQNFASKMQAQSDSMPSDPRRSDSLAMNTRGGAER